MKNSAILKIYLTAITSIFLLGSSIATAHPDPSETLSRPLDKRFKTADTNSDGLISKEEFQVMQKRRLKQFFAKIDLNSDNHLSIEELRKHFKERVF
tara:strand:+ start:210 stop:500 length:291 start_codon:yes stop_codon:yes gene_type:complete